MFKTSAVLKNLSPGAKLNGAGIYYSLTDHRKMIEKQYIEYIYK